MAPTERKKMERKVFFPSSLNSFKNSLRSQKVSPARDICTNKCEAFVTVTLVGKIIRIVTENDTACFKTNRVSKLGKRERVVQLLHSTGSPIWRRDVRSSSKWFCFKCLCASSKCHILSFSCCRSKLFVYPWKWLFFSIREFKNNKVKLLLKQQRQLIPSGFCDLR